MENFFLDKYSGAPVLAYGFHGCTQETEHNVIDLREEIKSSNNDYDWLGTGMYFWESNPLRALEWAARHCKKSSDTPAVIGACIDLSRCLNLLDYRNLQRLKMTYLLLEAASQNAGYPLPQNTNIHGSKDLLKRKLDCYIVNMTCKFVELQAPENAYTTVRGVFWEGQELYNGAGFRERNHIQICVRDPKAIVCYFRPRYFDTEKNLKMLKLDKLRIFSES